MWQMNVYSPSFLRLHTKLLFELQHHLWSSRVNKSTANTNHKYNIHPKLEQTTTSFIGDNISFLKMKIKNTKRKTNKKVALLPPNRFSNILFEFYRHFAINRIQCEINSNKMSRSNILEICFCCHDHGHDLLQKWKPKPLISKDAKQITLWYISSI